MRHHDNQCNVDSEIYHKDSDLAGFILGSELVCFA